MLTSSGLTFENQAEIVKHGYDRLGNRLYREDGVGVNRDELYSYDESNQLLGVERGKLNATKNAVTNKNFAENFVFDATGNWLTYERDDNGDQIWDLSQTRTHNKANEITCIDSSHANVAHDRNGNMTKMPKPNDWNAAFTCVYDAWNRLVQVKDGSSVTATYKYNGLNQRIRKTVGTTVTESVFNHNWQELESNTAGVTATYVWGLRYIDDLVCRDRGDERLYTIQDANWNVVALYNTGGTALERISYDAFGKPTWLDVNHGPKMTSGYDWNRTFTGQVLDSETGLMLYRNRFYHPELGRFVQRDSVGYQSDEMNLFLYVQNNPFIFSDPSGQWILLAVACAAVVGLVVFSILASSINGNSSIDYFEGDPDKDGCTLKTTIRLMTPKEVEERITHISQMPCPCGAPFDPALTGVPLPVPGSEITSATTAIDPGISLARTIQILKNLKTEGEHRSECKEFFVKVNATLKFYEELQRHSN